MMQIGIYVLVNFIFNYITTNLEINIQEMIGIYGCIAIVHLGIDLWGNGVLNKQGLDNATIYQKEMLDKYNKLDLVSREKDDPLIFKEKLDRVCNHRINFYTWQILTSMDFCCSLVSVILIISVKNQLPMLLLFIIINFSWYYLITNKMIKTFGDLKQKNRTLHPGLRNIGNLLMLRLHERQTDVDNCIINDTKINLLNYNIEIYWKQLSCVQRLPNLVVYICIPFFTTSNMYLTMFIIFKNLNGSLMRVMNFINQSNNYSTDLKAVNDFFNDKTYMSDVEQIDIPNNISFSGNVNNLSFDNLTMTQGDTTLILGETGAGKSTLIKALQGLIGTVKLSNNDNPLAYNKKTVYMKQNIRENTPVGKPSIRQLYYNEIDDELIKKTFNDVSLTDWFNDIMKGDLDCPIENKISGGQKTKLCIAICIYQVDKNNAELLILDEPEQGITVKQVPNIIKKIRIRFPNLRLLIISHLCDCESQNINIIKKWIVESNQVTEYCV